ncbi:RICIN domain-containing protein [uncultured Winogradskyella sp.]|uniref:PQQ-dependent sugar dehydrogenase n=1 Tax=uncultured Winogradskyella sp. TaxID=395353 RepID=UPI002616EB78|nr:RICIN domain-containing protein [uncultured Winogradskyella sp.]
MHYSNNKKRISFILFGISIFTILGVSPYFLGSGLSQPEAVGAFLNGNFPDVTVSSEPYRPAFPNLTFDSPLTFTHVPNSNVLVVGQRNGEIYWFENDETVTTKNLVADLSTDVGVVWDGGFLGLAIHPEFGTPGKNYFYTYYTSKDEFGNDYPDAFLSGFGCYREDYWGGFLYLRRYEVNPTTYTVVPGSELTMLKLRMFSSTHRGGSMDFGNDGFLYLTTGEQSAYTKSQNITTNLDGGVLRLDVDQDPTKSHTPIRTLNTGRFSDEISGVGYGIPNDNPFLSPSGTNFEEYYTLGHRNPHRMTKDELTGTFYIGEIGGGQHEEINIVDAGKNYGWPVYEGYATGPGAGCGAPDGGMYNNMPNEGPLVSFPRSEANAIIGGYVYRGSDLPEFYGKYICADYGIGEEIWAVDTNTGDYDLVTSFSPTNIISFGEDNEGELYLLSQGDNVFLYKLVPTNQSPLDIAPQLLSQTGAFQDLQTLTPSPGVIPYDLVESFWSDGAEKQRWMVIPNDGTHDTAQEKISFSENGDWEFPVGSVLIKHFEMPIDELNPSLTQRLETRFTVRASSGSFYYLTYKWNATQTDAVLLDSGFAEDIQITTASGSTRNQTWTYPGTQDCISCHNSATGGTIGPRTRNLNSDMFYPSTSLTANQLVTLSHLGILDETIDDNTVQSYQTHKTLDDPNASLDEKARSYLDLNCAYCHRPGGTGDRAQFDLRLSNSLVQTGLMFAGTNTPLGIPGEKIVVAGDASKSILYLRTDSVDQTIAMPPIAKNEVDQDGVDLIQEWINQLDPNYEDPTISASTYTITNVGSGLVMDIAGVSQDNFADVHQWQDFSNDNQRFIVQPAGGNYYTLKAVHSNKNIDVQAQGQDPGTNVIQYQENGTDAQLFSFEYLGNDQFAIKSKANGLYLGIENNSTNNGGSIKTYVNDDSDFFKWTFTDLLYVPVTGVSVSPESIEIFTDEFVTLLATITPNDASEQDIIWTSSDETVAIVDTFGNVTGISEGVAIITATTVESAFADSTQLTVISNDCNGTIVDHTDPVGSGTILARGEINAAEDRFKAFDNKKTQNDFSKWLDNTGVPSEANPSFISIEFDNPQFVNKLVITSANDNHGRDPENFRILGSNDSNFIELASWTGVEFTDRYQSKDFKFANVTAYKTYRLEITKNDDDVAMTQMAEIELIGCDGPVEGIMYVYDNGWLPSDPNGVAFMNDSIMVSAGEAVISSNTMCNDLTINPGAAVTIDTGATLTTTATTLKSTSMLYSSLIVDGVIQGNIKYERYVNSNIGGNDLISPPLAGEIWTEFLLSDTNASDILNDGNDNPRTYLFGPFDKNVDGYVNYTDDIEWPLVSGRGYRAGTVAGSHLAFSGVIPTGQINVNITDTGATFPDWNLIGNPYPSYLDMDLFLNYVIDDSTNPVTTNLSILEDISGIYGYVGNGSSNAWSVITLANASDKLMTPGQGFFVAANDAYVSDYDIVFDPSMRVKGTDDDFIEGRSSNFLTYLKLNAATSNKDYTTEFYFNDNASLGLDLGYDGKILGNNAPNFAIYSHLVQDNSGLPIALQALNPSDLINTIIPLGVNANQGEQLTFSISESTLPNNVEVYLEDNVANTVTLLNSGDYSLTPNVDLSGAGRFYLRISSSSLSVNNNAFDNIRIYTTDDTKSLYIKGSLVEDSAMYLYDVKGRLVLNKELNYRNELNTIDISMIGTGVYFVKLFNDSQSKTTKLLIK